MENFINEPPKTNQLGNPMRHILTLTFFLLSFPFGITIFLIPFVYILTWTFINYYEPTELPLWGIGSKFYVGSLIFTFIIIRIVLE